MYQVFCFLCFVFNVSFTEKFLPTGEEYYLLQKVKGLEGVDRTNCGKTEGQFLKVPGLLTTEDLIKVVLRFQKTLDALRSLGRATSTQVCTSESPPGNGRR